jgi:TolB protein
MKILWQRRAVGTDNWNLYTTSPDGSSIEQITTNGNATDASWSPDSSRIVYSSPSTKSTTPSIYVCRATGGGAVQVTRDVAHGDGAPSWSPDGSAIVFESFAGPQEWLASIWQIRAP